MDFGSKIKSLPQMLKGLLMAFLAIALIRATYPFANAILSLWTDRTQIMYYVSILIFYVIIFFVLYVAVWIQFFQPTGGETNG